MPGITRTINGVTAEWDGQGWLPVSGGPQASAGVDMHHPGLGEGPMGAAVSELARTGKEAALGLARSPLDLVKSLFHPIDAVTNTVSAVAHPLDTLKTLGDNPREAGSALGQLLLGKYAVPELAPKVPGAVGAIGRGMETAGDAVANSKIGGLGIPGLGAAEAIMRGDPKGVAVAAAPYALKYAGKGVQAVGRGLESLKGALTPAAAEAPEAPAASDAFQSMQDDIHAGLSPAVVNKLNGVSVSDISHPPQVPSQGVDDALANLQRAAKPAAAESPITPFTQARTGIDPAIFGGDRTPMGSSSLSPDLPAALTERYPFDPTDSVEQVPEAAPVAQEDPTASDVDSIFAQLAQHNPAQADLPAAWQPHTMNPVLQGLQSVLEGLRNRPTPGLTNVGR